MTFNSNSCFLNKRPHCQAARHCHYWRICFFFFFCQYGSISCSSRNCKKIQTCCWRSCGISSLTSYFYFYLFHFSVAWLIEDRMERWKVLKRSGQLIPTQPRTPPHSSSPPRHWPDLDLICQVNKNQTLLESVVFGCGSAVPSLTLRAWCCELRTSLGVSSPPLT